LRRAAHQSADQLNSQKALGWLGRVTFSKTGQTIYYRGAHFTRFRAVALSRIYYEEVSREEY